MLRPLVDRLNRERNGAPDLIVLLRTFEDWCVDAGFRDHGEALDALRDEGLVTTWRIQSGRIKLFFKPG